MVERGGNKDGNLPEKSLKQRNESRSGIKNEVIHKV